MNCAIQVHYLLLCFIFCAPSKAGKLTFPSTHAWACRVYNKGARVQGTFWVSALARPPVSHIIKIERGARRHLIPILAASCGCAAARGRQAKQKRWRGGGIPHAVEAGAGRAEHRQSLQRTTILWRHSSICQTCFVIIKWKMLHFHVRQAQDGAGDEAEDGAENVAEAD